jgi:hypothetical protein
MSNGHPAFRWDGLGISAYSPAGNGFSTSKFVRFDHHGIYGVTNGKDW